MFDKVVEMLKPILQSIQEAQERNSRRNVRLEAASRVLVSLGEVNATSAKPMHDDALVKRAVLLVRKLEDEIDRL